jgi:hypothetical protein
MKREKTAMRRLADLLKKHEFVVDRCPEIIEIIEELYIEVEKQQICMAYNDGRVNAGLKQNRTADEYYTVTYGK